MTDRKDKSSRVVRFAQTEADLELLRAIDSALESQSYSSFSDLCKQALHDFLLSPKPTSDAGATLHQQLIALQLQVARLEGAAQAWQSCPIGRLEQQLTQLGDRLEQLELKAESQTVSASEPESPATEPDPLLMRLGPLLEDF